MNIVRKFESWYDALQCAKHLDFPRNRCASREANTRDTWFGSSTFDQAAYLAEFGWEEGRDKIKGIRDLVFEGSEGWADQMVRSVEGSEVNVDGVIKNEVEQMFEFKPKLVSRKGRIIHICINAAMHCGVHIDEMMQYGGAVSAMIDSLETRNFRVELSLQYIVKNHSDHTHEVLITLKQPEQFLDWDVLSFWLIHPSAFRRICFAIWEAEEDKIRDKFNFWLSGEYSYPHTKQRGDVYLDPSIINHIRQQGVVVWVRNKLNEILKDFEEGYKAVDPNETEHKNEFEDEN